jgi:hypothetical protein
MYCKLCQGSQPAATAFKSDQVAIYFSIPSQHTPIDLHLSEQTDHSTTSRAVGHLKQRQRPPELLHPNISSMFKTEPPKHRCTVTAEDYFFLSDRIKMLENKLSQVALEQSQPALVFPKFNAAKLQARQSPRIQIFSVWKVFGTTELLESILLHLSERDLLCCQRVNKAFRATMQQSIKIKKLSFLSSRVIVATEVVGPSTIPSLSTKTRSWLQIFVAWTSRIHSRWRLHDLV